MIHTLNLKYDIQEARDYLSTLNREFEYLHWYYRRDHNEPAVIEDKNFMDDVHGWGLQTIYADPNFPYHCDIDPHNEPPEYFKDTPMTFGFFKKFKDMFSNPYRAFLMSFPANHHIGKWLPTTPLHGKIFLPLYSNSKTTMISYKEETQTVEFEEGKIYLFDMTKDYGEFRNDGDSEITFITFNVPKETFANILSLQGTV